MMELFILRINESEYFFPNAKNPLSNFLPVPYPRHLLLLWSVKIGLDLSKLYLKHLLRQNKSVKIADR